jgi:methylated-DNA-protein-cysteine methyltransferase-like protein
MLRAMPRRLPMTVPLSEIYAAVRAIPRGKVATYGQIAELVGLPSGHRIVARAMRTCPARLPWQRVVARKDARRAKIGIVDAEHAARQRALLEREGVVFDAAGFIVLRKSGWLPQ